MKEKVIITDVTRMGEPRVCVAGYLERSHDCVRPVFSPWSGPTEEWLSIDGQVVVRPFSVVELDLKEKNPSPPHTEDWIIDSTYRVKRGMLTPIQQNAFLTRIEDRSVESIFGATINREPGFEHLSAYVKFGEGKRSLGTIRPKTLGEVCYREKVEEGKLDYRIAFTDQTGEEYRLAVTDLAFRRFLEHTTLVKGKSRDEAAQLLAATLRGSRMFLRIGLARSWKEYPDRCYLQITGVYSFPDYLEGRCFADFSPERKSELMTEKERASPTHVAQPTVHEAHAKAYSVEAIRRRYPKAYAQWTETDDARLRELYAQRKTIAELADIFERKPSAIRSRLAKLGML
jgi:hypothetical protein